MGNFKKTLTDWFKAKTGQSLSNAEREANAFNAAEAEKSRDFQVRMYEEYNSPQAMMQQYSDAGLNPALMYEGYSPSSVSSNAQADSVSPSSEANVLTDVMQTMLGIVSAKQQIDLQKAQIKSINADTEGKEIDNANKQRMYDIEYTLKDVDVQKAQSEIKKNTAEVDKITQDIKESVSRVNLNNKQIEIGDSTIELQGSQKELNETKAIVEKLNADTIAAMLPYVQRVQEANLRLSEANTQKAWAEADRELALAENLMLKSMAENKLIDAGYYEEMALKQRRERKAITANATVGNVCNVIGTVSKSVSDITGSFAKVVDSFIPM